MDDAALRSLDNITLSPVPLATTDEHHRLCQPHTTACLVLRVGNIINHLQTDAHSRLLADELDSLATALVFLSVLVDRHFTTQCTGDSHVA